jgi:hypothetical protein
MSYDFEDIVRMAEEFCELVKSAKKEERDYIFPKDHPKVNDKSNHFPIHDVAHARNALARSSQFATAPKWYDGNLKSFVSSVARAVHKKFPSIEISDAGKTPGKG